MCSYVTHSTETVGSACSAAGWIDVKRAVVAIDHPAHASVQHALCVDFRSDNGDPSSRVAVELDMASARRLAEAILRTLDEERLAT